MDVRYPYANCGNSFRMLVPSVSWRIVFWALVSEPGFLKFQIFDSRDFFGEIFLGNMLVRYRGINNKGVLERPWTIWGVLDAISTTLKCQFTGKCRKVDFLTSCTTKSAETLKSSTVWSVRSSRKPLNPLKP